MSTECGQSGLHSAIVPTIVGGKVSEAGNFPWHAALFIKRGGNWAASCGGTLINTHIVLTGNYHFIDFSLFHVC